MYVARSKYPRAKEKPFTSSIEKTVVERGVVKLRNASPPPLLTTTLFTGWSVDISFKNDVTEKTISLLILFIPLEPNLLCPLSKKFGVASCRPSKCFIIWSLIYHYIIALSKLFKSIFVGLLSSILLIHKLRISLLISNYIMVYLLDTYLLIIFSSRVFSVDSCKIQYWMLIFLLLMIWINFVPLIQNCESDSES